ncbi:response regulator [Paenibacillus rhizovicinus]|uniref:Response regulator n=1 Tax=Paenibacillus rhizovicinus TaxID=2704463 RepID=A0A6C0P0M3_9BACL|nr:response regulator [Paenibacillus rhizovicinus]QHW31453.1 response regulator [Paenibacillus rhizovicinus]
MNLLLVEDEIRQLNNVATCIPWEEHDIEIVGMARSGKEALAMVALRKPDIVLLDLQLPDMNGLEIIRSLRASGESVSFVILSGHNDFSYARDALELGADQYLLKPAGNAEILAVVSKLAERLRAERETEHDNQRLKRMWETSLPALQALFLRDLVRGKYAADDSLQHAEEYFPGRPPLQAEDEYVVVIMEMDPLPASEIRYSQKDTPLLRLALQNLAADTLWASNCLLFPDDEAKVVAMFGCREEESGEALVLRVNVTIARLLARVQDSLKMTASAGIGSKVVLKEIEISFRQANRALHERVVFGYNVVIPYHPQPIGAGIPAPDRAFERKLQGAMESGDDNAACEHVEQWFRETCSVVPSLDALQEHVLFLHSFIVRMIHAQGWSVAEVAKHDYESFLRPPELVSKEQTLQWMLRAVEAYMTYGSEQRNLHTNRLIVAVMELAKGKMDMEMTLHDIADQLYMNPSYLSRLFKRETGLTFTAYYQDLKMQRARELMVGGAKVYEAARQVGFKDIGYFTRLFRKFWGVTPGEASGSVIHYSSE